MDDADYKERLVAALALIRRAAASGNRSVFVGRKIGVGVRHEWRALNLTDDLLERLCGAIVERLPHVEEYRVCDWMECTGDEGEISRVGASDEAHLTKFTGTLPNASCEVADEEFLLNPKVRSQAIILEDVRSLETVTVFARKFRLHGARTGGILSAFDLDSNRLRPLDSAVELSSACDFLKYGDDFFVFDESGFQVVAGFMERVYKEVSKGWERIEALSRVKFKDIEQIKERVEGGKLLARKIARSLIHFPEDPDPKVVQGIIERFDLKMSAEMVNGVLVVKVVDDTTESVAEAIDLMARNFFEDSIEGERFRASGKRRVD